MVGGRAYTEAYKLAIEASLDGIAILDANERHTYVSQAYADIFGYHDAVELLGQPFDLVFEADALETLGDAVLPAVISKGSWRGTLECAHRTGHTFPAELSISSINDRQLVCIVRDVSVQATREQELQRQNARLEEFAALVSHDLKNPLAVAIGSLELAEEAGTSEDFQRIRDALDRMEELIDDVLELARTGRTVQAVESVEVAALARRAWSQVTVNGATLEIDADRVVMADPERLQTLFENLFGNAIRHVGPEVTVRITAPDTDTFSVEDDGPGIPEEAREQVFESGYTTDLDGTGYGLAIVRNIAEAHGWSVRVEAGDTGGARFVISGVSQPPTAETAGAWSAATD
jgi:PAS domain S-box-containing protein